MDSLNTNFVRQYHDNIYMLLQQAGGVLAPYVRQESQESEKQFFDQIGSVVAEQVTTRFPDSPVTNTPSDRRMVTITPYHVGDFIDSFEKVQTMIDPSSAIVENFVKALKRERDRVIYESFFGTAYTGKDGTSTESFPTVLTTSSNVGSVVDVDFGSANSGLTVAKLVETKRAVLALFWEPEDQMYFLLNSAGLSDLLNLTAITSADYNTIKALVSGNVDTFMGFKFVQWEGYVKNGVNVLKGTDAGGDSDTVTMYPVWQKGAVVSSTGMDIDTQITQRGDKSFMWYGYARAMYGATRMEKTRVLKVERYAFP
jgi:hypothetical protein